MATMNISLPEAMKHWTEQQAQSGRYANSSDYIRDLIRKDQDRQQKINQMQILVNEGLESGAGTRSMEELKKQANQRIREEQSDELYPQQEG